MKCAEPLFRPSEIPASWRYWVGRFQIGAALYDFAGWCPEWVYERVTGCHPPAIRRPACIALALLIEGADPYTVETLPANPALMATLAE